MTARRARAAGLGGILVTLACLQASGARAAWVVNERGECVRTWTAASLVRGPTAILNAPLLPLRSAVGGFQLGRDNQHADARGKLMLPPFLAVAGGAMGLVESLIWVGTGLCDTLTAGYLEIAPEEATRLSAAPVTPRFASQASPKTDARDPCGRPAAGG